MKKNMVSRTGGFIRKFGFCLLTQIGRYVWSMAVVELPIILAKGQLFLPHSLHYTKDRNGRGGRGESNKITNIWSSKELLSLCVVDRSRNGASLPKMNND